MKTIIKTTLTFMAFLLTVVQHNCFAKYNPIFYTDSPTVMLTITPTIKGKVQYSIMGKGLNSVVLFDTSKIKLNTETIYTMPDTTIINNIYDIGNIPPLKKSVSFLIKSNGDINFTDSNSLCKSKNFNLRLKMKMVDACPCRIGYEVTTLIFPLTKDTLNYWKQIPVIQGLAVPVQLIYKDGTTEWHWFFPPKNGTLKKRDLLKPIF